MRKEINAIVRNYAINNGNNFEGAWNHLYHLYNRVCHKNIKRRANTKKVRPLDMVEMLGDLDILKTLAEIEFVA